MKNLKKKYILIALAILGLLVSGVFFLFSNKQEKQSDTASQNSVRTWDAETASFKEYASYEKMEQEQSAEREKGLEEYGKVIKGTIVEQIENIKIPSYLDENQLAQLQDGEITVRSEKSSDFPDGVFQWGAYLTKNVNSFIVGDFNNDEQEDVAHIIGYTGGGSGYFYNLTVFINDKGKLKYITQEELGDRVVIKSLKYKSGEFIVDMITQGEGDDFKGYCCPNVPATIRLKIKGNRLVEI